MRCEEDFPRVAYVCLGPRLSFVTFPAPSGPMQVWGGTELRPGEIVFHGRGERLHQSTPGSFAWNVIALDPFQLERHRQLVASVRLNLRYRQGNSNLLPTHTADFGPDLEFLGLGSSVFGGSDMIAAEMEQVVDLIVG